ncbi:MAG: hypothetical protein QXN34_05550 [Archaeoglobaceae archaeon]
MRGAYIFTAILLVALLAFCTQPSEKPVTTPSATTPPPTPQTTPATPTDLLSVYKGFKDMQKGEWAQWKSDNQVITYVFVGKETINGKTASGIEFSSEFQGRRAAIQIWISEDGSAVKYVAKFPEGVFCVPLTFVQTKNVPSSSTPEEYTPKKISEMRYELGKHTVSGKIINVVKIFFGKNETWISGEVPFGMVKMMSEGKTILELIDFGAGKSAEISLSEVLNCKQFPIAR